MMPPRMAGSLASLLRAFTILFMLPTTQALAEDRTVLPNNDRYAVLGSIQQMHQSQYPNSGPVVTVFEIGGGDPAMNGSFLYLRIEHNEQSLVWNTGLNVRSVKSISLYPRKSVLVECLEDYMDSASTIKERLTTYRIAFKTDNNAILNTVKIEKLLQNK